MADGLGVWLYGISRGLPPERLTGLTGLREEPVYTIEEAGLVAVASSVRLAEFGAEPLRRNLEDLNWLAGTARTHDSVVNAIAGAAPAVVPLRLATVYLDNERVRGLLVERRADFEAALDRLTGVSEWGVKGYGDPDVLAAPTPDDDAGPAGRVPAPRTCCGAGHSCPPGRTSSATRQRTPIRSTRRSSDWPRPPPGTRRKTLRSPANVPGWCSTAPTWWTTSAPRSSRPRSRHWAPTCLACGWS